MVIQSPQSRRNIIKDKARSLLLVSEYQTHIISFLSPETPKGSSYITTSSYDNTTSCSIPHSYSLRASTPSLLSYSSFAMLETLNLRYAWVWALGFLLVVAAECHQKAAHSCAFKVSLFLSISLI